MPASLIYRSISLYELTMMLLYGRHYFSRQRAIADLIPAGATAVEVCCGPGRLYSSYLRTKSVAYIGVDSNKRFIDAVNKQGGTGIVFDLRENGALPAESAAGSPA